MGDNCALNRDQGFVRESVRSCCLRDDVQEGAGLHRRDDNGSQVSGALIAGQRTAVIAAVGERQ